MIAIKKDELELRMARLGYTGAGLARAAGISQSYIVLVLSGKRTILAPTAKKICDTLKCDFDEIFELKAITQEVTARNENK